MKRFFPKQNDFLFECLSPFVYFDLAVLLGAGHCSVVGVAVQLLRCVWPFATPWASAHQSSLSFTISWSWFKLKSIKSVMPSNNFILCHLLLLLPSILPSIRVFSNELALQKTCSKYWSFSFRNSPSNEYLGLISFRIDWFDLLAVQGTLKSLLQHHNLKVSVLRCSAYFFVQLSYPYITTGKTIWVLSGYDSFPPKKEADFKQFTVKGWERLTGAVMRIKEKNTSFWNILYLM